MHADTPAGAGAEHDGVEHRRRQPERQHPAIGGRHARRTGVRHARLGRPRARPSRAGGDLPRRGHHPPDHGARPRARRRRLGRHLQHPRHATGHGRDGLARHRLRGANHLGAPPPTRPERAHAARLLAIVVGPPLVKRQQRASHHHDRGERAQHLRRRVATPKPRRGHRLRHAERVLERQHAPPPDPRHHAPRLGLPTERVLGTTAGAWTSGLAEAAADEHARQQRTRSTPAELVPPLRGKRRNRRAGRMGATMHREPHARQRDHCGRRRAGGGSGIRSRSDGGGDGARARRSTLAPATLSPDLATRIRRRRRDRGAGRRPRRLGVAEHHRRAPPKRGPRPRRTANRDPHASSRAARCPATPAARRHPAPEARPARKAGTTTAAAPTPASPSPIGARQVR